MFVEIVRLLIVVIATAVGFEISGDGALALGALLGAGAGYVVGGVLGRFVARALGRLERRASRLTAVELVVGGVGGVAAGGLGVGAGLPAVLLLPGLWGWPVLSLSVWIAAYGGFRVGVSRSQELLDLAFASATRPAAVQSTARRDALVVDGSALADGRVIALARQGFLRADIVVPRGVVDALRHDAESVESAARTQGRRALDGMETLAADPRIRLHVVDGRETVGADLDAAVLAVARELGAGILTVDGPLAGLARSQGLPVLDLQRVAESLAPVVHAGDRCELALTKPGREPGQGIGYLEDGSMVVVPDADHLVGGTATVEIVSSVRTTVGRMFFAELVATPAAG